MKDTFSIQRDNLPHFIGALAMLLALALLFTPFWRFDGQSASINAYVWNPGDQKALETYLKEQTGEAVNINNIVGAPILLLALTVIGDILFICQSHKPFAPIFSLATGITGIWALCAQPVFRLGACWGLHLAAFIAALLAGLWGIYESFFKKA